MLEDKTFLDILKIITQKSTCSFFKTGALIVKDNRIVSMGYNGTPSGFPQCDELQDVLEFVEQNKHDLSQVYTQFGTTQIIVKLKTRFSFFKKYSPNFLDYFQKKLEESIKSIVTSQGEVDFYVLNFIHSRYEVHAEQNAIAFSLRAGTNISGSTLYSTLLPCMECAKLIVASDIKRVVFMEDYEDKRFKETSEKFLKINGVIVEKGG